jgi:hypothetical protein
VKSAENIDAKANSDVSKYPSPKGGGFTATDILSGEQKTELDNFLNKNPNASSQDIANFLNKQSGFVKGGNPTDETTVKTLASGTRVRGATGTKVMGSNAGQFYVDEEGNIRYVDNKAYVDAINSGKVSPDTKIAVTRFPSTLKDGVSTGLTNDLSRTDIQKIANILLDDIKIKSKSTEPSLSTHAVNAKTNVRVNLSDDLNKIKDTYPNAKIDQLSNTRAILIKSAESRSGTNELYLQITPQESALDFFTGKKEGPSYSDIKNSLTTELLKLNYPDLDEQQIRYLQYRNGYNTLTTSGQDRLAAEKSTPKYILSQGSILDGDKANLDVHGIFNPGEGEQEEGLVLVSKAQHEAIHALTNDLRWAKAYGIDVRDVIGKDPIDAQIEKYFSERTGEQPEGYGKELQKFLDTGDNKAKVASRLKDIGDQLYELKADLISQARETPANEFGAAQKTTGTEPERVGDVLQGRAEITTPLTGVNDSRIKYLVNSGIARQDFLNSIEADPEFIRDNPEVKDVIDFVKAAQNTFTLRNIYEPLTKKVLSNEDLKSRLSGLDPKAQKALIKENPNYTQGRIWVKELSPLQNIALDDYMRYTWNKLYGSAAIKRAIGKNFKVPSDADIYLFFGDRATPNAVAVDLAKILTDADPSHPVYSHPDSNLVTTGKGLNSPHAIDIHSRFDSEEDQIVAKPFGLNPNEPQASERFGYVVETLGNEYINQLTSVLQPRVLFGRYVVTPADYRIKDLPKASVVLKRLYEDSSSAQKLLYKNAYDQFQALSEKMYYRLRPFATGDAAEYRNLSWEQATAKLDGEPMDQITLLGTGDSEVDPQTTLTSAAEKVATETKEFAGSKSSSVNENKSFAPSTSSSESKSTTPSSSKSKSFSSSTASKSLTGSQSNSSSISTSKSPSELISNSIASTASASPSISASPSVSLSPSASPSGSPSPSPSQSPSVPPSKKKEPTPIPGGGGDVYFPGERTPPGYKVYNTGEYHPDVEVNLGLVPETYGLSNINSPLLGIGFRGPVSTLDVQSQRALGAKPSRAVLAEA